MRADLLVAGGRLESISGLPEMTVHGQGGFHDVVPHPEFAKNSLVYLAYAARGFDGAGTELARGKLAGRHLENVEVLFRQSPKGTRGQHFGGTVANRQDFVACQTVLGHELPHNLLFREPGVVLHRRDKRH